MRVVKTYNFFGSTLDIGCGSKPYQALFKNSTKYVGIDFKNHSENKNFKKNKPDLFFEKTYDKNYKLPFKNELFDNSIALQVLEHHQKPEKLISEMARVTKKEGLLLLTAPFLQGIHESPHDYQRFTRFQYKHIFEKHKLKILEIKEVGSIFFTIYMLFAEFVSSFAAKRPINYIVSGFLVPLFIIMGWLSVLLDKIFVSKNIFYNYTIVLQKL